MGRETREFDAPEVLDGTIVLQLGYDGSGYSGFAEQPGQTTVAGEIRRAVETFLRRPIELTCAGRTDAGVHAISQYVSFPATAAELEITRSRWRRCCRAISPCVRCGMRCRVSLHVLMRARVRIRIASLQEMHRRCSRAV